MRGRPAAALLAALGTCGLAGCASEEIDDPKLDERSILRIYTVNHPLKVLAERVAAGRAQVVFPAPPGVDPAEWLPAPEVVAAYQAADLVLLNGAGYAQWVSRVSLRRARLVDTSAGFRERLLRGEGGLRHAHGPGGSRSHADTAFTLWLDPELALEQARAIAAALARARPADAETFGVGLASLESDLVRLDARLARVAGWIGDAPLLFSHPVYGYFARRYGLNARSLHWEPDVHPDDAQWRALQALRSEHPAAWLIWEAAPLPRTAARLVDHGVGSIVLDPSANPAGDDSFLAALERAAASLESAFEESSGDRARLAPAATLGGSDS